MSFDNFPNSRLKKVSMKNSNNYGFETLSLISMELCKEHTDFEKNYRIREIFRIAHFVSKFIPTKEKGT
jgi:hypothetical protein